jgi:hypothetical protein
VPWNCDLFRIWDVPLMFSNSPHTRRRGWRYLIGLSLLGFLIIASASHSAMLSVPA